MGVLRRGNSKHWYVQFQLNGKTYIRSSRSTDKRLAESMEREWRRQLLTQEFLGHKPRVVIRDVMDQYIQSKINTPNHRGLVVHQRILNRLFRVTRYLDVITSQDLERLKRDREKEGIGPATITHSFNQIRGTWKYARKMGYQVSELHFPEVKLPKHRLRYLSIDEEKRLLKELDPKRESSGLRPYHDRDELKIRAMEDSYDLVVLLLDTGARYSEIANIEWSSINLDDKTIRLWRPKVQNESVLYMTQRVCRVLHRRFRSKLNGYVFNNKAGGPRGYTAQSIRKAINRSQLSDCTIHTLRHTFATRLIQNGLSVYEVKEMLGHSDIKTTMRYAHLEQREVTSRARDVIDRFNDLAGRPDLKVV